MDNLEKLIESIENVNSLEEKKVSWRKPDMRLRTRNFRRFPVAQVIIGQVYTVKNVTNGIIIIRS